MAKANPKFADIPMIAWGNYEITVPWVQLERVLEGYNSDYGLDLNPDFQRVHVWTLNQQIKFVEFILRGGKTGNTLLFNKAGFPDHGKERGGPMVLVDGKQRLNAVRLFLRDLVPAFGNKFSDYEDKLSFIDHSFRVNVNNLATRKEVLKWYLDFNSGGTVHTTEELSRVQKLLEKEG